MRMHEPMRSRFLLCLLLLSASTVIADEPLLVVLTETGRERDGLPVLALHPQGAHIAAQLDRGFSGELLRVHRRIQKGNVEPAYLLLSTRQGGFARYGFWLGDQKKGDAAYIDVHQDWEISGRLGAIDQIFPHELGHAVFHHLGIESPATSGGNQVHAVAVRTDRFTAFNEGFAEHFQIMAVDHPDAAPATHALANDRELDFAARRHLAAYRRELTSRLSPATRMRIGFPLWYSNDERALRYFAVKRNEFTREVLIPDRLLTRRDPIDAYFLDNTLPGDANGAVKPVARLIVTEGALSTFFHRWATNRELQQRNRDATRRDVTPLQNVYLKIFQVMATRKPQDARQLVAAYRETFPDEAPVLDSIVREVFHAESMDVPSELWLANTEFETGTTIFDQFRGAPRAHPFDLNAASLVDLTGVPGVSPALARAILQHTPYASLEELARVPGVSAELVSRMKTMAGGMAKLHEMPEDDLSMRVILMPYVCRIALALLVAAIASALLYRFARLGTRPSVIRTIISGLGAALVGLLASWVTGYPLAAVVAVVVLFGIPAALWQSYKSRRLAAALTAIATWTAAALPAVIVTTPWFA